MPTVVSAAEGLADRPPVAAPPACQQDRALPPDLVSLPMGIPHSIHNRSGRTVKCLFWVSPTHRLYDYFRTIYNVHDVDLLTKLAAEHEVPFIAPTSGS
jgi:hypothetical protein